MSVTIRISEKNRNKLDSLATFRTEPYDIILSRILDGDVKK
jgi:hypothetical protein